ncbi:MAG: carboxypeptidase regulatory-like domain-containing protein [Nitrospirae bacterium]|nr:carboxypeptidase regulatory-like domain-containing protein [Nitrospirota bacterium]MBI3352849.1 carboxypeptidase regulatory-like domain-containing protein [Nitrospirota bacterium]
MSKMGRKNLSWVTLIVFFVIAMVPLLMFVGCGSSSSNTGTGTVSGVITDSSGAPIGGATVVAGTSSPTAITDKDGNFTIAGVPSGTVSINAISPGYNTNNFTVVVFDNTTTTIYHPIHLPDIDDFGNAPMMTNAGAPFSGGVFAVTATINATTSCLITCTIVDARAELVGYGVGTVLNGSGSTYTGTITLPASFVGPSALIKIFAIDNMGRVGATLVVVPVPGASGSGNFTASTINGNWGGSAEYHRAAFGGSDRVGDKRRANLSFTMTPGGNVTGKSAIVDLERYFAGSTWSVITSSFNGTSTLIDANLGIYQMTSSYALSTNRTLNLTMTGKLNSATSPSYFVGYFQATITDTTHPAVNIFGHFELDKNLTWATSDLAANWVWSSFIRTSSFNLTYTNPFQYNSAFTLNGTGDITPAGTGEETLYATTNTLGTSTPITVIDPSLGIFHGVMYSSTYGTNRSVTGLLGPAKKHVLGFEVTSKANETAYGTFWGSKIATPPHYAAADFAEKRHDGALINSIWRGFYYVTGSNHTNAICYLSLWMNPSGNVVGGKISSLWGSCPSVTRFTGGSLSFADTTDGRVSGSATDGSTTFTIAPTSPRNASMGVYKERLVGDFSVNNGGTDTGFFFLARTLIE